MTNTRTPLLLAFAAAAILVPRTAFAQPRIRFAQRANNSTSSGANTEKARSPSGDSSTSGQNSPAVQPLPVNGESRSGCPTKPETLQSLPGSGLPAVAFDPYVGDVLGQPNCAVVDDAFCPQVPKYRFRGFGEYLFLQPGSAATTSFAIPINGAIVPPPDPSVPVGPVVVTDPGYQSAFRAGIGYQTRQLSEWAATATYFSSDASAGLSVDPAGTAVIHSLVIHPSTSAADTEFLDASATSGLELLMADLEYRGEVPGMTCSSQSVTYVVGGRFARLDQDLAARFTNNVSIEDVGTETTFEGGGLRVGLEGERQSPRCGFLLYGRGFASLVAGRCTNTFTQTDNFAGAVVSTSWKDDRIVPILDLELGVGWQGPREHLRVSAGYLVTAWYNVVGNAAWTEAVHQAAFQSISDTLIFDGAVARAEFRF